MWRANRAERGNPEGRGRSFPSAYLGKITMLASFLMGLVGGQRSMTPLAAVAVAAARDDLPRDCARVFEIVTPQPDVLQSTRRRYAAYRERELEPQTHRLGKP